MRAQLPELAHRVRRQLAETGGEPTPARIVAAVQAQPNSRMLGHTTLTSVAGRLSEELTGAGVLSPLLADQSVTDVLINAGTTWVDRGAGLELAGIELGGPEDVRRLAQRLVASAGRRLDDASPYADVRLPDGTRLHAVLPPIATHGPYLSFRTFRRYAYSLEELVQAGAVEPAAARLLHAIVIARLAYLVTGGTGSGKTTLLNTLLSLVPPGERIVTVEDAAELRPLHPHTVGLQARTANVEGAGEVSLRDLVRQALRMRPDRLVVGECRGAEVVDLLTALNTGHEGGAATLHANAPADVPVRLEALGLLGGIPRLALHAQLGAAVQVAIQLRRTGGRRMVDEICLLAATGADRLVQAVPVWRRSGGYGPGLDRLVTLLNQRGCAWRPE